MKQKLPRLLLLLTFALTLLALSACGEVTVNSRSLSAAAFSAQVITPTPNAEDHSEIGSTDGIFILGLVILGVSALPILLQKKR